MKTFLMYNIDSGSESGVAVGGLVLLIFLIVGIWKVFTKAGKPGWAVFVPFYNLYCLYDMAFGNGIMFLLLFVPCVNLVIQVMLCFKLAKAFNKGVGFGFGLLFFNSIFLLILGFGDAKYIGPQ